MHASVGYSLIYKLRYTSIQLSEMQFLLSVALITTAILFQSGYADYWFHTGVSFYNNPTNSLSNGSCCNTSCLEPTAQCCTNDSCNLATHICFREADQPHTPEENCTRGEFTYPYLPEVMNSRSMIPVRGPLINAEIQLYIRLQHVPVGTQLDFTLPLSNPTIDEFYYDGSVAPINEIIPLTGEHGIAQIIIQMFYRCAMNFYGSSCATYCQERDDETGHYTCASDGSRECLNGYTDPMTNCTTPEDGAKTGQDLQNPRNLTEYSTTIGVQDIEPMTRSGSESAEHEVVEFLSVADVVVIVNSGVLDVLLLVGLVLLAVTIAKITHRQRRSKREGDKCTVFRNGKEHATQRHHSTSFVIQREGALETTTDTVDSTYERITNYIV